MSDPTSSGSPQVKFVHEWLQAIQTRDLDSVAKCMHKDYRHIFHPRSLGTQEQTKEGYLEYVARIYNIWTEFEVSSYWVPLAVAEYLS